MRTEVRLITPQLAEVYLSKNKHNRHISKPMVAYFADQMKRGQWALTGQGISFDYNNNLIDGQHRLLAIIQSNISVKMLVIFEVDAETFSVYDTGKKRSPRDVFSIEGIPNATNLTSSIGRYMAFIKEFENPNTIHYQEAKITNDDMLMVYRSDMEFWDETLRFAIKLYKNLRIYSLSMTAAFMAYLIKAKSKDTLQVRRFMLQLFDIEPSSMTVIDTLRRQIINSEMTPKKMTVKHKTALLIKTWNYYESGRDIKKLSFANTDHYPKVI